MSGQSADGAQALEILFKSKSQPGDPGGTSGVPPHTLQKAPRHGSPKQRRSHGAPLAEPIAERERMWQEKVAGIFRLNNNHLRETEEHWKRRPR